MKTYKICVTRFSLIKNEYVVDIIIVKTKDIYHEIGKIYCILEQIKDIHYEEIKNNIKGNKFKEIYFEESEI